MTIFNPLVGQLMLLFCLACLAVVRAAMLRRQGIAVISLDRNRTAFQKVVDALLFFSLLYWFYASVVYCVAPQAVMVPTWLHSVLLLNTIAAWIGLLITLVAVLLYGLGVWDMGKSWRLGIDRVETSELVTTGIFAYSRNPIYVAFNLLFLGSFLIHGRLVLLILLLILGLLIHLLVLREETFLAERFGNDYRNYCNRVGRYFGKGGSG